MFRKLVLPEPDGPVTVTNSPWLTWISKPRSAWVSIMWVRYTLERLVMRSMGCPFRGCSYLLMETRAALAKVSVPAMTTLSPGFTPDRISTADTLVAPSRIGVRTAIPSCIT